MLKMLSSRAISINVEDITVRGLVMKECPEGTLTVDQSRQD